MYFIQVWYSYCIPFILMYDDNNNNNKCYYTYYGKSFTIEYVIYISFNTGDLDILCVDKLLKVPMYRLNVRLNGQ